MNLGFELVYARPKGVQPGGLARKWSNICILEIKIC